MDSNPLASEDVVSYNNTISISANFCFRGEGDKDKEPFRGAFANIGELRSICPKATLLALTATSGPSQRRRIMKMLCFR